MELKKKREKSILEYKARTTHQKVCSRKPSQKGAQMCNIEYMFPRKEKGKGEWHEQCFIKWLENVHAYQEIRGWKMTESYESFLNTLWKGKGTVKAFVHNPVYSKQ